MVRSTKNQPITSKAIGLLPCDDALIEPPVKPRAIRRKASLFAKKRKQRIWLAYGGDQTVAKIKEDYSDDEAKMRIGQQLAKARYDIDPDHNERLTYELRRINRAHKLETEVAIAEGIDTYYLTRGRRTPKQRALDTTPARLAWVEYPSKPSRAQIRTTPRKCKDQFCGCRGYTPLGAAVTR